MDDALHTGDLDLDAVSTRGELAAMLREVRIRADRPSLRTLETMTRHGHHPLSKTAVAEMLNGLRLPRKVVMVTFLRACGVREDDIDSWQHAWERVASREAVRTRSEATQWTHGPKTSAGGVPPQSGLTATGVEGKLRTQQGAAERPMSEDAVRYDVAELRQRESMWHFPDGSPITLVSYRLPRDERPPSADPDNPNYSRYAGLADLDTLIDIHGAVRAHNPASRVAITAAQDLTQPDVATHLVLIGGLTWEAVTPWFSRIFSIPIEPGDPFDRRAIVVRDPDAGEREFTYTVIGDEIIEDVGFFASGQNPSAPRRTLTICGGITTRGVRGAALSFIDPEMRELNEQYLMSWLPASATTYCLVMRVPILNRDPLASDLSKKENRLFEWCDTSTESG